MKLDFIPLDKLSIAKVNMRHGRKQPDIGDILPSVRARGVLQSLIVRPNGVPGHFEVIAGRRRYHAASVVAEERRAESAAAGDETILLPCAILDGTDDAGAVEASLIENFARLDPDEVTQWEGFVRLIKEGRNPDDIAATFGLPDLAVRRILALGNLLPRIRDLYRREEIDAATVRHLTLASKGQQRSWLALFDDPDGYVPTGHQLKAWLFGGQSIPARFALFDLDGYEGATIADLFGDDRYFADADAFWAAQNDAIEARRATYLEEGWSDVVIVPPSDHFHGWEYEKAAKRKGGRVYVDVRATGEVTFHEGYLTRKEAQRVARGDSPEPTKVVRPEITSTMQAYVDLHRHAAVRAAMLGHPGLALRLMVAHAIGGSHLWRVSPEPQSTRNDAVRESLETCRAETAFDERRRAILVLLGVSDEEPTITGCNGDDQGVANIFHRLIDLPDAVIMEIITIVMGETLASGSAAVEAVGMQIGIDMADWWIADTVFLDLVRDKAILSRIVAEVAGETVAAANAGEKGRVLKRIAADYLSGADGRAKADRWVPRWMAFPPSTYTDRGGVGTVTAYARVEVARPIDAEPEARPEALAKAA